LFLSFRFWDFEEKFEKKYKGKSRRHFIDKLICKAFPVGSSSIMEAEKKLTEITKYKKDEKIINLLQWTKCTLAIDYPEALRHIQQFESDSKLFRSIFWALARNRPVP
jgi:hypothetical protein